MEVKFVMDTKSIKKVADNLRTMLKMATQEAGEALETVGHYIMAESSAEVPYQTGTLQSSGYVKRAVVTSIGVVVEIGYGGPNDKRNPDSGRMASEYMVYVHEDMGKYHPYGKAQFLRDPVERNELLMREVLAGRLKYAFTISVGR